MVEDERRILKPRGQQPVARGAASSAMITSDRQARRTNGWPPLCVHVGFSGGNFTLQASAFVTREETVPPPRIYPPPANISFLDYWVTSEFLTKPLVPSISALRWAPWDAVL